MNQTTTILPVTPWHKPTESLLGYALRVSEQNGYDSPWHIMGMAGLPQGQMDTAGFPVDQFAAILGRKPEDLQALAYYVTDDDGKRHFQILGQSLSGALNTSPLRLNRPQLCPHCVKEHGYIDAFFDLRLAVACPDHGRTLVNACPSCGKPVKWFRQGLLTCKCGADLGAADTADVSPELKELMAIIKAKVHGNPLTSIDNPCGFPLEDLDPIPLRHLLEKVSALGRCNLSSCGRDAHDPTSLLQSASELLRDWPRAFHAFLRRQKKPETPTSRLSEQYEELFSSLLNRHKRLPGGDFLLKEFTNFAKTEWEGVISWQLAKDESDDKRFLSNSEMASRMGVDRRTLAQWGKQNIVPMKTVMNGTQTRYVVDAEATEVLTKAEGKSFGEREAATYVGLPVSVLQSLRRSRHFSVKFLSSRLKTFHESDLNAFVEKMLALGDRLEEAPANTTSLEEVLRRKFKEPEGKGDFVRAILDKTIGTTGRTGETIGGLLFPADHVETFLRHHRAKAGGDSWSMKEAAQFLHCDSATIPALIEEGLLDAIDSPSGKRVTEKSAKEFDAQYVSLAKLAKDFGTSSRGMQTMLSAKNVTLKIVNRSYGKVAQPFVLRSDCARVRFV